MLAARSLLVARFTVIPQELLKLGMWNSVWLHGPLLGLADFSVS